MVEQRHAVLHGNAAVDYGGHGGASLSWRQPLKEPTMTTVTTLGKINTALQDSLLATVDALSRRRACDIPEQTIDRFVALRWLQWNGGNLRLTATGEEMLVKVHATMLGNLQAA
jgi:hypothetical protein